MNKKATIDIEQLYDNEGDSSSKDATPEMVGHSSSAPLQDFDQLEDQL